jgi:hypothetical protein
MTIYNEFTQFIVINNDLMNKFYHTEQTTSDDLGVARIEFSHLGESRNILWAKPTIKRSQPNPDGFVSLECSFSFLQLDLDTSILDADILDTF